MDFRFAHRASRAVKLLPPAFSATRGHPVHALDCIARWAQQSRSSPTPIGICSLTRSSVYRKTTDRRTWMNSLQVSLDIHEQVSVIIGDAAEDNRDLSIHYVDNIRYTLHCVCVSIRVVSLINLTYIW